MTAGATQTVGPVVFDYVWWQQRYPELSVWVGPAMAQNFFDLATLYLDNTDGASQPYVTDFGICGSRSVGSPVKEYRTAPDSAGATNSPFCSAERTAQRTGIVHDDRPRW
jgi:hypothetical protein